MTNQAINMNHIFASNSRLLVESKLVTELENYIEQQRLLSEAETKQMLYWVLRFLKFHNHQHPTDLAQTDVESFLSSLATENHYNQKLQQSAEKSIQYLYNNFLKLPIVDLKYISVQQRKGYLSYFGKNQCKQVVNQLSGKSLLLLELMLLGKLRLSEVVKLRESDVDIKNNRINVFEESTIFQENTVCTERKLLFTISIPLKLILDLRIQKMRIRQCFDYSTAGSSNGYLNRFKKNKIKNQKSSLLFHSSESFSSYEEQIANIKQAFKQDLKQAIVKPKNKMSNLVESRDDRHFQQLRMALGGVAINKSVINHNVKPVTNLTYKRTRKSIQFELEVA